MESNSAIKEPTRPISEGFSDPPHLSIPTLECQSEFMKNLKRNQVQQSSYEAPKISSPPVMQPISAPPPMQPYYGQSVPFSFMSEGAEELNEALNHLISQDPKFLNNPALVNTLKILEMATIVNKQTPPPRMNEMPMYRQPQMVPSYQYSTQSQNWMPQSMNQSMSQTMNQSMSQPMNQSIGQSIAHSLTQQMSQPMLNQNMQSYSKFQQYEGSPHASINQSLKQRTGEVKQFIDEPQDEMYNYDDTKNMMNDLSIQYDTESEMSYRFKPDMQMNLRQSPTGYMQSEGSTWQPNFQYSQSSGMMQQTPGMMGQTQSMIQQNLGFNPYMYQSQNSNMIPPGAIMMPKAESSGGNVSGMNQTFGGFQQYPSPKPAYQQPFAEQKINLPSNPQKPEKKSPSSDNSYLKFYMMQQQMNENEDLNFDFESQMQNNSFNPNPYDKFSAQNKDYENIMTSEQDLQPPPEAPKQKEIDRPLNIKDADRAQIQKEIKKPQEIKQEPEQNIVNKQPEKQAQSKPEAMEFNFNDNTKRKSDYDDKPIKPMKNDFYSVKDEYAEENDEIQLKNNADDNSNEINYDEMPLPKQSAKKNPYDEKPIGGSKFKGPEEDIPIKSNITDFEKLLEKELRKNPDAVGYNDDVSEPAEAPKREFLKRK